MDLRGLFSRHREAKHGLVGLVPLPLPLLVLVPLPLLQIAEEEMDLHGCFSGHSRAMWLVGLEEHGLGLDDGRDGHDGLDGHDWLDGHNDDLHVNDGLQVEVVAA